MHMAENSIVQLPVLTKENLSSIMKERILASENSETSIPILWQGFLEASFESRGFVRTIRIYIPKNLRQTSTFVLMNVPEGEDLFSFLQNSGWIECADRSAFGIACLEPVAGGWQDPEEEAGTFSDCMDLMFSGVHFREGTSVYAVGYGDAGRALHMAVLSRPLQTAAAVFVDASAIGHAFLSKTGSQIAGAPQIDSGIRLDQIPVPVWMVGEKDSREAEGVFDYWVSSCSAERFSDSPEFGTVFRQTIACEGTPEGDITLVCRQQADAEWHDPAFTARICRFLTQYSRYGKQSPFGNSLVRRIDYQKSGVEIRYFTDLSGIRRECLIYVPKAFRNSGKLPLIFGLHGACESMRAYFEQSQLQHLADQEGLIVVMPEASLNPVPDQISGGHIKAYRSLWNLGDPALRYTDLEFFDRMLDQLIRDYPIDESRMYLTGHSMGCMMTNFISSSFLGKRFAAAAGTSGHAHLWNLTEERKQAGLLKDSRIWDTRNSSDAPMPIMLTMGQYDLWDYDVRKGEEISFTIDSWLVRNRLAAEASAARLRQEGAQTTQDGRYHVSIWKDQEGIPWVRYEWIELKDHMNCQGDNLRFWKCWFSHWSLGTDGARTYTV